MVKASPILNKDIDINLTERRLTHRKSISDARPISSGDKRSAKGQQGLNGSVIVDETHVITRQFISESSIDMAGISREEPMYIEVSTAGKDPDDYGKSQYDRCKKIAAGEIEDQSLFFLAYEAPQDLSDEALDADPVKWGKLCNPTWGRIVKEEEFLSTYNQKKQSLADLADFKTMRLNIWQQAASPWLRAEDWAACKVDFRLEDMEGDTAYPGIDLAKTRDMTAIVLVFPRPDGKFRIVPYFFMSEGGLKRAALKVAKLLDWEKQGLITKTPGEVTDYSYIEDTFASLAKKFRIEKFAFDKYNAEYVTQRIAEAGGFERIDFGQTLRDFNEATKEFERLVVSGKIEHDGNPVLAWQIGHAQVMTSRETGYQKPVKPSQDDPKKIDGLIAGIMGLAICQQGEDDENWYRPGLDRDAV